MKLHLHQTHLSNGRKAITIIADTDQEEKLIMLLNKAFHEGSVTLQGHNHAPGAQCLDCQSCEKYRDCVTIAASFGVQHVITG